MSDARWERIKRLFHETMERPADQRVAFMDAQCAGDPDLRADLQALVDTARPTSDQGPIRTGGAAEAVSDAATTNVHNVALKERPGTNVGPYKLLQPIGEGGFGIVFLAEQSVPVRRRVALKVIKLGMDTKAVVARFEAERQALALMDHPHIARVLDGGATEHGRPYFVMEYVVGDPITKFADERKLTVSDRLSLFSQVCSAVQHAHTKGVIHRDIKPANVLVSMVDGKPFAKVIDFGIAKATASPLTDKTLFTEHKQLIGTPEYMSPEQAEGSNDIDTRTDVYALGVLLYELLTGATPFEGTRLRSAAWGEMQRIIREEEPPMPSVRLNRDQAKLNSTAAARAEEPARLSTLLKGELDWIVMKALDKDRGRRYESPNQLAADVQRHLAGEAVVAAPVSKAYRLKKFVRRNKGPVLAGSAVAITLLLGIAATSVALYFANYNATAAINNATIAESANASLMQQRDATLDTLRRVALSEFAAAAHNAASPIAAKMYILADGSHVWVRRRSTDSNDFVISEDPTGQNPPLPDSPQVAIAHDKVLEVLRIIIDSSRRELADTNASLTRQRDASLETLTGLAESMSREWIASGQVDLSKTDPPGFISHVGATSREGESQGVAIYVDETKSPKVMFYKGSLSAHPIQFVEPTHADPDLVQTALTMYVNGAVEDMSKNRLALEARNALITRQRDIAREAIYAVSKATNCDVCDELGSRSVADAFISAWMNGPSGAPFKDAPEEERQIRALADFSIYNAKRLFEETKRARLAEAEVQLSTYTDWESAPRARAIEPLITIHNTRKELLGDSHVDTIKSLWMLGALRFEKGELDRGMADLRLSVSTLEALPAKPFDLLAALYDNLLHAELVFGNWDAATSIVDRLRSLITSDEALNGNWTNSGYGPFRPHFLYTPRLFTWQNAFVQSTHQNAIETMRETLAAFDRESITSRYAPIVRDWALAAVVEPGDPNWAPFLANVKRRAALTATTLAPTDPEALTALALSHYRAGEFSDALRLISKAIELRASRSEEASPIAAAAEAMICFQIGDEAHVARARAALTRAKSLPIDSTNTKPWARSNHAKPILAEAQALIEGVKPK